MSKIKLAIFFKNKEESFKKTVNAIKDDNKIIYRENDITITILKDKMIRENNEFKVTIDFKSQSINYLLKNKACFDFKINLIDFHKTNNSLKINYSTFDDEIEYTYMEV